MDTCLQSQETIDYFQEKEASNQLESINDTDPDLPAVALYMERSYIETLKYTLQILYLAHKSLWYYSLSESTSLGDKIAFNPITNVTYNTLKDMQTNLIQDLVVATEFQRKDPQHINGEDTQARCRASQGAVRQRQANARSHTHRGKLDLQRGVPVPGPPRCASHQGAVLHLRAEDLQ